MSAGSQSTFKALCDLLEPFNTAGVVLQPNTDISADLNIDSVSVMDFVMEVEDHFDIDIPLNVLSETRTLNDLVAVVESRTGKEK
jgi:acyl carrier protein